MKPTRQETGHGKLNVSVALEVLCRSVRTIAVDDNLETVGLVSTSRCRPSCYAREFSKISEVRNEKVTMRTERPIAHPTQTRTDKAGTAHVGSRVD